MFRSLLNIRALKFSRDKILTRRDAYNSLYINLEQKINHKEIQEYVLQYEKQQKQKKSNAIWIFLNSINLQHIPYLVNELGYRIHHGIDNRVTVYKWLSQRTDLVPPYSNFYVSCGAVVIDNDHLLLVQQKSGPRKDLYGIPGGRSDVGEFLQRTAERQLFQQTGIVSTFQYFIYFRQMQNTVFGANDIYFGCMMKPEQSTLRQIKLCDRELMSYQWIHLSKLEQFVKKHSIGTQYCLGKYLNQLYNAGYNFKNTEESSFPNISSMNIFSRSSDKIARKFMQHKLICK